LGKVLLKEKEILRLASLIGSKEDDIGIAVRSSFILLSTKQFDTAESGLDEGIQKSLF